MIGCPVQKREWIIDKWFWHVNKACVQVGVKPAFIFVMDESDEPMNSIIHNCCEIYGSDLYVCSIDEVDREDKRIWNNIRFERMSVLRNILLDGVRKVSPPHFLSLDSDILIHLDGIKTMLNNIGEWDAIGR